MACISSFLFVSASRFYFPNVTGRCGVTPSHQIRCTFRWQICLKHDNDDDGPESLPLCPSCSIFWRDSPTQSVRPSVHPSPFPNRKSPLCQSDALLILWSDASSLDHPRTPDSQNMLQAYVIGRCAKNEVRKVLRRVWRSCHFKKPATPSGINSCSLALYQRLRRRRKK